MQQQEPGGFVVVPIPEEAPFRLIGWPFALASPERAEELKKKATPASS